MAWDEDVQEAESLRRTKADREARKKEKKLKEKKEKREKAEQSKAQNETFAQICANCKKDRH